MTETRNPKLKRIFAIAIILSMMTAVFPAFAEFEQLTQTGSWEICERTHWKENVSDTIGWAEWNNKTVENFTGYYATIRFSELTTEATPFWFWENYALTTVSVWLNFTGSTEKKIVVNLEFMARLDLWGLIGGLGVRATVREDLPYWGGEAGTLNYVGDVFNLNGYSEIFVYQSGDNLTVKIYNYQFLLENPKLLSDFTFNVTSAWFDNVTFNLAVRHDGFHPSKFEGYLEYEDFNYTEGTFPEEKGLGENIFDLFYNGLVNTVTSIPQWLRDPLDMMYGWLKWLLGLSVGILWQITALTIPFIPIILVCWGFDVVYTATDTGSIQPIGTMFMTIWSFTVNIISAITGTLGTIWSFIKFW